jgi:hypothetical protein
LLGILSGLAVLAAVLWRVWIARGALPLVRTGAALASIAVLVGLVVWARGGPLEKGWAARAGTPASLLGAPPKAATVAASHKDGSRQTAAIPASASLPAGRFDSNLHGILKEVPAENGLVTILIDARAKGRFDGRVHLALRGQGIEGGGVQLIDSVVGLLPTGAGSWATGRVIGLNGQQVLTSVRTQSGGSTEVLLDLHIDGSSGAVTGLLHGGVRE